MKTPMERAPDPELAYRPIPKTRYTSPDFARAEWEHMWTRVWLMAGRESDIPEPGDYMTFEIGVESLLILRQKDGSIGVRHNVCMHRGNRLREPGRGHVEELSCLFHGWRYSIDGTLIHALDADRFPQGVPKERLSLQPVRSGVWAGFVFVCFDDDAPSLEEYLGILPEHFAPYRLENWQIGLDMTIEIDCNWKTSVDAFNEAYHIAATHTWTLEFSDDVHTLYDCYERHSRMIFPELQPSPRHEGAGTVTDGIRNMFLERIGVDTKSFTGTVADARAAFAKAVRDMGPVLGADFSNLNESQMCDDFHYTIFPNVTFNTHSLFLWIFTHRPHPDDPNKMYFDFINLVNAPDQDIPRPEKQVLRVADGDTTEGVFEGGELLDEDLYNLPRIQSGMRSRAFEALHLGEQEIRILHHQDTLMRYIGKTEMADG
jgi:phenylpropionate dioxygenase-like ring-hydroxylating dioxygenase large terminal subunit